MDGAVPVCSLARDVGHTSGKVVLGYGAESTRCRRSNEEEQGAQGGKEDGAEGAEECKMGSRCNTGMEGERG